MTNPLTQPCSHVATPEEQQRDPDYRVCAADPGQPCRWARRYDGAQDPPFHSERLEFACNPDGAPATISSEAFDALVLGSGLV